MYKKWSNHDLDQLCALRHDGVSELQCSIILDRTLYAVRSKLAVLAPIPQPPQTARECPQCGGVVPPREGPGKRQIYCTPRCGHRSSQARDKETRARLRQQADRAAGVIR